MPSRPPRRPPQRQRGLLDEFASWSTRRKLRLARTVGILLVIVLLVWQCTGDDDPEVKTATTTIAPRTTSTAPPVAASAATATPMEAKLPALHSLAGGTTDGTGIVLAGGLNDKKNSTDVVWRFDPATGSVTESGKLPSPLHTPAIATTSAGALMFGGGKGDSVFDTVLALAPDGTTPNVGKLPRPRTNATAVTTPEGDTAVIIGGYDGKDPTNEVLQTTDGVTYETVATLLHPVRFPTATMLGRSVWVIGGEDNKTPTTGIQRVDLDTGQVTDLPPLPVPLSRASAFTLGGSVFVAGGRTLDGRSNQIYRIDPITGATTAAGTLPDPRSDATIVVAGTTAYLFGGLTTGPTDSIIAITAA